MNKTIWKAVFFITLTIFAVLTVLLIAFIHALFTQTPSVETGAAIGIIGGADLPTYRFPLRKILQGPIFNIWLSSLLTVIISLIGWLTAKK